MDFDLTTLLLDLLLTFVFFTIFPFVRFYKKRQFYTYKEIKKFNIINSIVVQIIILFILIANDVDKLNIAPAFLYYFFNQWLWTHERKPKKQYNEEYYHSDNNNIEESESDVMKLLNSDKKDK